MTYYNSMDRPMDPDKTGLAMNKIGVTAAPMRNQLQELQAKIRGGFSKIELGFWGAGKGSEQQPTPGTYGTEERRAMRDLAKVNNIELTTHSSPIGVAPLSGITERGYSEEARKNSMDEIRRAVDFAADVADGGAVVFHVGEFNRPVKEAGLTQDEIMRLYDENGGKLHAKFKEHDDALDKVQFSFVNKETGQVTQENINLNQKFYEPKLDSNGNIVYKDKEENEPEVYDYTFKELIEEARSENVKRKQKGDKMLTPAMIYMKKKAERDLIQAKASEGFNRRQLSDGRSDPVSDAQLKLGVAQALAQQQQIGHQIGQITGYDPVKEEKVKPTMITVEEFALEKSGKAMAELGMYTREKQMKAQREGHKFSRDLFIAPENVFPEQYGGHPEEFKKMIKKGRQDMAAMLMQKNKDWDKDKAMRVAKRHIKGTVDMAHANLWQKYYNPKEGETAEEGYKKWYMEQMKGLRKAEVLGHVHISDNLGYSDEHLSPGHGNVPVRDLIELFKDKNSNTDFIIETGSQGDEAFLAGFREFSSPIYGLSHQSSYDQFGAIEHSYFRTAPPYFLVGEMSQQMGERVSKDFSSWSGVPFE